MSDHHGKIVIGHMHADLDSTYRSYIPDVQYGAARNRQTKFASHTSTLCLSYCESEALCAFVLSLDSCESFEFPTRV